MKWPTDSAIRSFQRRIFRFYKTHGRDLPWRRTADPYKITVAEIMLQQTQVERVLPKYLEWTSRWPDWRSLAHASRRDVLTVWSGLGYNRRALYLHKLAQAVTADFGGELPRDPERLKGLPGIGPYTSKAILIFAYNQPLATIDTNIRRVLLHEFHWPSDTPQVQLQELANRVLPKRRSRDWHNALMDYSRLTLPKRLGAIAPLTRQAKFEGSLRQIRGEIIRRLTTQHTVAVETIMKSTGRSRAGVLQAAYSLAREGTIRLSDKRIALVDN